VPYHQAMPAPTSINPRSIRNEACFVLADELTTDQLGALGQLLLDRGQPVAVVQGILGWLSLKAAGVPDRTAQTTRARYRRILAELGSASLKRVMPS
jgi:hypothetical protein